MFLHTWCCVGFPSKKSSGEQKIMFLPHFWQQPQRFLWNKYKNPVANMSSNELNILGKKHLNVGYALLLISEEHSAKMPHQ